MWSLSETECEHVVLTDLTQMSCVFVDDWRPRVVAE